MRLALLAVLCACAGAPPKPSPSDPLAELNRAARAAYAEARERALANAGPVLIVGPARITLLHAGARSEFELSPARYHDLKAIAHFALWLHALHFQSAPDPARLAELRATAANALDAARTEIADLDAAVEAVRRALGPAEFARLHVIVVGAHMAREGEVAMQYFEKLLGEREGLRLVFAEGLWDEPSELQLLATHLLDASVGEGFFGDSRRMHRDLLSDAAAQVLAERGR